MTRLAARLILALALLLPAAPSGEPGRPPPLARPLRLSLWGATLAETAKAIQEQTGVEVFFYIHDLPPEITNAPDVHLATGNVTLGVVMEALARAFAFRFRVAATGRIEISRGYDWVGTEPSLRFVRTPPVVSTEKGDQDFRALLSEMVKPLRLLGGDFALRFEAYPLPDRPDNRRGALVLPGVLADYMERGLRCLAGDAGDFPPPSGARANTLFARARDCGSDWEELLSRRMRAPTGRNSRAIIEDAALGAGVAIVVRTPPADNGRALASDVDWYTLGRICEILATGRGFGKRVFLACGAVVFENGDNTAIETDSRSRELFWDGLAVAGFDVKAAVERTRDPLALTSLLRRDIFPSLWRDPVCSMTYSPIYGRLAVTAPVNVLAALNARIAEISGRR